MAEPKFGDIYLVHGRGFFSKLIRFWTRSRFAHAGIVISKDTGFEATPAGVAATRLADYRKDLIVFMTPVAPLTNLEKNALKNFIRCEAGKGYDWWGVLSFVFFEKWQNSKAYYCHELVWRAYDYIGRPLGRLDENYVDGHLIYASLALKENK